MEHGPKKATDIILELQAAIAQLTALVQSQNLNLGIISNKLNKLLEVPPAPSKIVVEAVNTLPQQLQSMPTFPSYPLDEEKQIPISSEDNLPEEMSPKGFRRTSRPETFSGDDMYLKQPPKKDNTPRFPVQVPKADGKAEIVVPNLAAQLNTPAKPIKPNQPAQNRAPSSGASVPTMQRIVDRHGKSVFLADVEITDNATLESVVKTRTNGTGKWQASLPLGEYKVVVRKRESLTKEKVEAVQNIRVDGTQSPFELQVMIIK